MIVGKLMHKVIEAVIYTIIDDYVCLGYLGFLQENLSKHDNSFEKKSFNDFSWL